MKKGDKVRQVIKPIEGSITKKEFMDDTDKFRYLVEYLDADGETIHQVYFNEDEIEVVEEGV